MKYCLILGLLCFSHLQGTRCLEMLVSILVSLLIAVFLFYHFMWKRRALPPGPMPWPLLGNLDAILRDPPGYEAFIAWRQMYGSVYTYWIAEMPIVAVADYQLMQETFVKDAEAYVDRLHVSSLPRGKWGIIPTDGELWREQRRFALHVLRDFGIGKNVMQEKILADVTTMLHNLKEMNKQQGDDRPVDIGKQFDHCIASIINSLLFGYRFEGASLEEFDRLQLLFSNHLRQAGKPLAILVIIFPMLKALPVFKRYAKEFENHRDDLFEFFNRQIDHHRERCKSQSIDDEPRDFVDAFLREANLRETGGKDVGYFHDCQLSHVVFDLWMAGYETTTTTLIWAVLYLLHHPDIQDEIHAELDREIGSDRLIEMNDRSRLVYLSAFINVREKYEYVENEVERDRDFRRLRDVQILSLKIYCTKQRAMWSSTDIRFHTGLQLFLKFRSCCWMKKYDNQAFKSEVFPRPYEFDPGRFIDENRQLKKVEQLVPFSVGKRQCLGESLARMELFLVLANLFNQFKVCLILFEIGICRSRPSTGKIRQRYQNWADSLQHLNIFNA